MDSTGVAESLFASSRVGFGSALEELREAAFNALRRRWLILAIVFTAVMGAAIAFLFVATPQYTATVRIKIDPSQSAALGRLNDQVGTPDQLIVDTEVSAMRSLEVATAVVRDLKLTSDPEILAELTKAGVIHEADRSAGGSRLEKKIAGRLLQKMTAVRQRSTYMAEVRYVDSDPVEAARIANAFAEQYIVTGLDRRSGTAGKQAEFLAKQLQSLNDNAKTAELRLAEYRASAGVISGSSGISTMTDQQMAPLASQLATAQSEAAAANALTRAAAAQAAGGGLGSVSAVLNSDVIRALQGQRAEVLRLQADLRTRYGPLHPEVMRNAEQVQSIDGQIRAESERIVAGLKSDAEAANARVKSLSSALAALKESRASDTRSSAMADIYQREADSAKTAYNRLAERAEVSDQAARSSLSQAQIIERASPPSSPTFPNRPLIFGAGLFVALFAGLGSVAVIEGASTKLLQVGDIEKMGLRFLGSTPRVDVRSEKVASPADLILEKPFGAYAEFLRSLRASLDAAARPGAKVFAIASTLPDEGKSTAALSLARVMALGGVKVLIIDGDLRRTGLSQIAELGGRAGVYEVLKGEIPSREAVYPDKIENLHVLPVAKPVFVAKDMFGTDGMAGLLKDLRDDYEYIFIDTPPLLGLSDARSITRFVDGTALVIRWNSTTRKAVMSALSLLRSDSVRLLGAILTATDKSSDAYGGHYYSRRYAQYYKDGEGV